MTNKQLLSRALTFDAGLPPSLSPCGQTSMKHHHLIIKRHEEDRWKVLSHENSEYVLIRSGQAADTFIHQADAMKHGDTFIFISPEEAFAAASEASGVAAQAIVHFPHDFHAYTFGSED